MINISHALQCCLSRLNGMVLPKKITSNESDLLFGELILFWQDPESNSFPSEDWFDAVWISDPRQRARVTEIFSLLVEELDEKLTELDIKKFVWDFYYDKATYSGGFLCLSKAETPKRNQNTVLRFNSENLNGLPVCPQHHLQL